MQLELYEDISRGLARMNMLVFQGCPELPIAGYAPGAGQNPLIPPPPPNIYVSPGRMFISADSSRKVLSAKNDCPKFNFENTLLKFPASMQF